MHYQARDMSVVRGSSASLRWCSPRLRPRSKAMSTRARASIAISFCGAVHRGRAARSQTDRFAHRCRKRGSGSRPCRHGSQRRSVRAAVAVVPQQAWVCAAYSLSRVRASLRMSAVHGVARRTSLSQAVKLSPLRLLAADAESCRSVVKWVAVACGPVCRARRRRGSRDVPRGADCAVVVGSHSGLTEMREIITRIESGDVDIIVGTQIVAKGHNFRPLLATVGIVDGDLGLSMGAIRARASGRFQLLHQVDRPRRRAMTAGARFRADAYAGTSRHGRDHRRRSRAVPQP